MDPVSVIGLVGSVVGIVDVITKSVSYLSGLQSSYKITDLKVRLLIGQLSTLKAALDQVVDLIYSRPDVPRDNKLVNDLSVALACIEAIIFAVDDRLSSLQRNENKGLKALSKAGFVWDEQTINEYLSLLNNQVNTLNLFLTALQCRTTVQQTRVVQSPECQSLLRLVRDDTSSMLWLRDAESIGTCKSAIAQDLGTISTTFGFDTEVFASKVYRTATRSSMMRTLLLDATTNDQSLVSPTVGLSARQAGFLVANQPPGGQMGVSNIPTPVEHHETLNIELGRPLLPSALPKYTMYTLDALQKLPPGPAPSVITSPPSAGQHGVERRSTLLTRPSSWLARSLSRSQSAISPSQRVNFALKVVLMGISESGKTTLFKSLKMGYLHGYTNNERLDCRNIIRRNLFWATDHLVAAIRMDSKVPKYPEDKIYMEACDVVQPFGDKIFMDACDVIQAFGGTIPADIFDNSEASPELLGFSVKKKLSSAVQTVWNQVQSHQALEKIVLSHLFYTLDSANHWASSSKRILDPNYIPTDEDILYYRTKTTGIYELAPFVHDDIVYQFFDLGGVRDERKKWIHVFENVNTIIFTCDVSCYDRVLLEESTQNRMMEQILLFDSIINSRWFINNQIVVLFTKEDQLTARKLLASPFQRYFPDYYGHPEDVENILNYLVYRLRQVARSRRSGRTNLVFCRSESISSSTTSMGEVAINAIQKKDSFPAGI